MVVERFDLMLLGCGTASKLSAWHFAKRDQRVAVIERKYVGGSCPNIACLPSKNVIYTAQVASYVRRRGSFGIRDAIIAHPTMVEGLQALFSNPSSSVRISR